MSDAEANWAALRRELARHDRVATVTILEVTGSVPRGAGARMIVRPDGSTAGTIGGGALEWQAMGLARAAIGTGGTAVHILRPADVSEHWCGTQAVVLVETWDAADVGPLARLAQDEAAGMAVFSRLSGEGKVERTVLDAASAEAHPPGRLVRLSQDVFLERFRDERRPVHLFGAGHVGRAIAAALAPLSFRVTWIDSRADAFAAVPDGVEALHSPAPEREVEHAPAGSFVVVATHSHPGDLAVVARALARDDLGYVGLIGSAAKKARFLEALERDGLDAAARMRLVCPIGLPAIRGKEPATIAASLAADLTIRHEAAGPLPAPRMHGRVRFDVP